MSSDLISRVADVSEYQQLRAIMATLNNAAIMAGGWYRGDVELRAEAAIDAADALLEQLGFVDPDTVSG